MSTTRTKPSPEIRRWRNAVFTIFALTGFVFATWASRVPAVRDLLHATTQEMGFLILGMSAGSIVGVILASHVVARLGATRTILWVYGAVSIAMIVLGPVVTFVPAFAPIFVVLIVLGAASVVDVAMNLSGAANERAIGRTIMPLFHASFSGGTVLGAGIGALLASLGVPMGVHFSAVGIIALVTVIVLVRFLQPAERPLEEGEVAEHGGWRSRLTVWRDPRVLLIGVIVLGMAFAEGSANDWLSLAMVDGHGLDNAGGAAVLSVFLAAMTIGRIGGVFVLDRFGRVPVLRVSAGLAVVGLLLVIAVPVDGGRDRRGRAVGRRRLPRLPGRHVGRGGRPAHGDRDRRGGRDDRVHRVPRRAAADRAHRPADRDPPRAAGRAGADRRGGPRLRRRAAADPPPGRRSRGSRSVGFGG